jgi:hypothetical protein
MTTAVFARAKGALRAGGPADSGPAGRELGAVAGLRGVPA